MDNIFMQIAAGFAPAALTFVLLSVFTKKNRICKICAAALSSCAACACLVCGLLQPGVKTDKLPEAAELDFAYALMDEDAVPLAADVIKSSRDNFAYTNDITLALARAALLDNKTQAAKALYRKLETSEEQSAVLSLPDGYTADKTALDSAKKLVAGIIDDHLDQNSSDNYNKAAKIAAFAENTYAEFLKGSGVENSDVSKQLKRLLETYEETPELKTIAPLRISRLKLQLLDEDFKGIAQSVDENADHNELLIVSELYMNGYIRTKDFTDEYKSGSMDDYAAVTDALENVYNNYYADKPRDERNAAKAQLQALKAFRKNPSLAKIENGLEEYAKSGFAYDKSKVYLQLAKTENYMGNSVKSTEYLDKSLNTVGDCDDAEYTVPMYEIIGIIADKDDPERLKDVAEYTDRILTNTMTVKMSDKLLEPAEPSKDDEKPGDGETEEKTDFSDSFNTYVSQKRMAISIVGVDISEFDTVKADINISGGLSYSIDELKSILRVSDCEIDISDFTLEKVEYSGANILICADVSGSMAGQAINDLKSAVKTFVESSDKIESVALVTFSSDITGVWGFGTPNEELAAAAESLRAGGGTNMYGAVREALNYFDPKSDEINCVILLSDGEDNHRADYAEITGNIGKPYKEKGVTLYSLGLGGGAAGNYLSTLAVSTGGKYVYASDSVQIRNFFDGLRSQILNSYRLTFRAEDTIQNRRVLRVALDGESYTYDERSYSLEGGEEEPGGEEDKVVSLMNKSLSGFEEKLVYKSDRSRKLNFKGSGFMSVDKFSISLEGNINYDSLAYEYVDESTLSVTLPAGVACDTYDVRVSVNGKKTVLTSGLTVAVQGGEKETVFGDYVFTSFFKETSDGKIRLSQYVQLNGWLNFKGEVILTGDLDGQSITMTSNSSGYAHYYEGTAEGLASLFVNKDVPVPPLGTLTLNADSDKVSTVPVTGFGLSGFLRFSKPSMGLYPDRVAFESNGFSTELPFQDKILSGLGLFDFNISAGGSIGAKSIDVKAETSGSAGWDDGILKDTPANLGNIPLLLNTDEFELRLDTYVNEFYVKYVAALPILSPDDTLGMSMRWVWGNKDDPGLKLDEAMLYGDHDITLQGNPVRLTFSEFKIGLTGLTEDNPMFVGGCKISAYQLNELLPGIGKWMGEIGEEGIINAEDVTISFGLRSPYIGAKATITCLSLIELGDVSLEIGKFDYTNKLLGLENETVGGISAKLTAGPAIHTSNCDITMQGSVEITATNRAIVVPGVEGIIDIAVSWWVFTKEFHAEGRALLGVQFTHDGDTIFLASASGGENIFYIQYSLRRGADYGTRPV